MKRRLLGVVLTILLGTGSGGAFQEAAQEESELELVWTCPVHREVTEAEGGACPICARELEKTLVQTVWSCPVHAVVSESAPGRCPICARELFPVTEEVSYVCPMHAEVHETAPGACPICHMELEPSRSARPHQDHNPKHGGTFFMAPDNWHHLEGTYPEEGVFRVYLYDNFSQPMSAAGFEARAVLEEVFDAASKTTRELVVYPLKPAADGAYLEARVGTVPLPREITAKIRFDEGGELERFDFVFSDFSREAAPDYVASDTSRGFVIPKSPAEIVRAVVARNENVRELVSSGAYTEIYIPALEAKDLALALAEKAFPDSSSRARALAWSVRELVRAAWLLDDYGDLGNREKVEAAYRLFDGAVAEIARLYP